MELLNIMNPWWETKHWKKQDKQLREYENMEIKWLPKWTNELSFRPFSLNFVVGPRQVGKTTGIKLIIEKLLQKHEPYAVLYIDAEMFADVKEFREALLFYNDIKDENGIENAYIFIDEASSLTEWWKIVKAFIDTGIFKNDVITVSGSSTLKILKHLEAFPGRRGFGKDIEALPLSFIEFLEIHGIELKKPISQSSKIEKLFQKYKIAGGYAKSINGINFMSDIIASIEGEIEKNGKDAATLKQIISSLYNVFPSATSYNNIAHKIGISHKTVESYLYDLENLFILKIAYHKDGEVNYRKEKKIFIRDPYIVRSLAAWCNKEVRAEFLLEFIVQEHMLRRFGEIYYYRNSSYEIDCISKNLCVEIKTRGAHRRYPKNVIVLTEEDIPWFLIELFSKNSSESAYKLKLS